MPQLAGSLERDACRGVTVAWQNVGANDLRERDVFVAEAFATALDVWIDAPESNDVDGDATSAMVLRVYVSHAAGPWILVAASVVETSRAAHVFAKRGGAVYRVTAQGLAGAPAGYVARVGVACYGLEGAAVPEASTARVTYSEPFFSRFDGFNHNGGGPVANQVGTAYLRQAWGFLDSGGPLYVQLWNLDSAGDPDELLDGVPCAAGGGFVFDYRETNGRGFDGLYFRNGIAIRLSSSPDELVIPAASSAFWKYEARSVARSPLDAPLDDSAFT